MALVQFGGDREGASECHRIVTLDRQWDSLEEMRSLTIIIIIIIIIIITVIVLRV